MTSHQARRPRPRLTDRGRMAASAAVTLGLVGALWGIDHAAGRDARHAVPGPQPATSPAVTTPSASPTMPATPPPSLRPTAAQSPSPAPQGEGDPSGIKGMVHTGLTGTGTWTTSTLAVAPATRQPRVHTYVVKAEGGTGIDANDAARQVAGVLNDPRGWTGVEGNGFQLVTDEKAAEFVVYLASPGRVQKMCPLDVRMTWSCSAGKDILLNTDRWLHLTPTYTDRAAYRAYMVNHEVGHYIGRGHLPCGARGQGAPVMMQQSKGLDGCHANPWPLASERR